MFKESPSDLWAPAGMYKSAILFLGLYKHSYTNRDRQEAIDLLNRIIKRYPQSAYSNKARYQLAQLKDKTSKTLQNKAPGSKTTVNKKVSRTALKHKSPTVAPKPSSLSTKPDKKPPVLLTKEPPPKAVKNSNIKKSENVGDDTLITGLRYWSNPDYTRVVIDAKNDSTFHHRLLKKDPDLKKPQRLYVDLDNARLGNNVPKHTEINDNLLIQARAGQHTPHSVRVVVDIKSFDNYKIFSLKDPFRLVIDVWGKNGNGHKKKASSSTQIVTTDNLKSSSITKQLALGVRKIVIDPGHGGKDPGAPGWLKGVWEKDVVLKIAKRLAKRMRDRLQCDVVLTRSSDIYLTLEERTAIANTNNADLFISLHCNAAKNRKLRGFETYFLNLATDDQAIEVAARENATSRKNISDLESILNDLMKNAKINESSRLASLVQGSLYKGLKRKYSNIKSLGVKQAPFYVLLGARMPSILIESSFLSNKIECKRLVNSTYQTRLCDSIIDGVKSYMDATNPKTL